MTTRMRVAKIPKEELEKRCAEGTMYADFVPIGHWIAIESEEMKVAGYYCSNCDLPMETEEKTDFCPNCGADMRENNIQFRTFPDTEQSVEDRFRDIVTGNAPDAWKFNVNAHGGVHLIVNDRKEDGDSE